MGRTYSYGILFSQYGRRNRPFSNIYLGGTFDCIHRGHLNLFRAARKLAKHVTVGLNTDEFATRYKRKPIMPFADRVGVLVECRLVDQVVPNVGDEDSKLAIVNAGSIYTIDAIGHGDDWTGDSLMSQMGLTRDWLDKHGISMVYLPYTPGISTTDIVRSLTSRQQPS